MLLLSWWLILLFEAGVTVETPLDFLLQVYHHVWSHFWHLEFYKLLIVVGVDFFQELVLDVGLVISVLLYLLHGLFFEQVVQHELKVLADRLVLFYRSSRLEHAESIEADDL